MKRSPFVFLIFLLAITAASFGAEFRAPGHRPVPAGVHVLKGGRVVVKPGEVIENGMILIRDGWIESVGKEISVPAGARIWDLQGLTVYAGFIDPYLNLSGTLQPVSNARVDPIIG